MCVPSEAQALPAVMFNSMFQEIRFYKENRLQIDQRVRKNNEMGINIHH